jgi:hypothetical protein
MIATQTKFERDEARLLKAIQRAKEGSLSSAAFLVRNTAIKSIRRSKRVRGYFYKRTRSGKVVLATYYEPAPPGQPILAHRKGVGFFRAGIKYAVDKPKEDAVVGWSYGRFQTSMQIHEHGGTEGGTQYDARPTMAPALEANVEKFHRDWKASVA